MQLDMFQNDHNQVIQELIERGALFAVNHSGGKDSQAMMDHIRRLVPHDQIVVIYAPLPGVVWEGTLSHIKATNGGFPLVLASAVKTFFDMVEHRQKWPSPKIRNCTSDLKRGPIEREIRRYLKANPRFNGLVVNCQGLRAEESPDRAKRTVFERSERNSLAGREWYEWLPIHGWTERQVFQAIEDAGEKPHWAYVEGMRRLSCCFCIMATREDLQNAARLNPDLYARYVETERRLDQTLIMPTKRGRVFLEEFLGIPAALTPLAAE